MFAGRETDTQCDDIFITAWTERRFHSCHSVTSDGAAAAAAAACNYEVIIA